MILTLGQDEAAIDLFEAHYERLTALVHQRMEIEWRAHRRRDIEGMEPDLLELLREFGELLRVVLRYDLPEALRLEAGWFASVLTARGPGRDAFGLLVDSWIMAIQGLIKPPECHTLAAPLRNLRDALPAVFTELARRAMPTADRTTGPLAAALIAGDADEAIAILRARIADGCSPHETVSSLLLPAMRGIGLRWETGELPIYREHLATEAAIAALAALPTLVPPAPPVGRRAMVGCVPRDHMQIVPLALAAYLRLRGWSAVSLGQGMPADQVVAAARDIRPDAVMLSLSMVSRLSGALEVIGLLKGVAHPPAVLLGGRGAEIARHLIEETGAFVARDFDEAHRRGLAGGGALA